MLKPLPAPGDLVQTVYLELREAVIGGSLAPGSRLGQEDLAARFGISRQPVLQALAQLERDGLAVRADGRGTLQVAPLDPQVVHEFYQLRAEIDALAARLAAERIHAGVAEPLPDSLVERGLAALRRARMPALIAADTQLHRAIYEASGNRLLAALMEPQWGHLERVMSAVLKPAAVRAGLWDEHAAIVAAINAGDAGLAATLARHHAIRAAEGLLPRLAQRAAA
ncbi:GntR family transcriptional regulator [Bordetella ansorpii]|uniref:GntR family transcriptional regulator n=1 Tax=Bordetella ansorpii TaxID=288768 RepID=A0A157SB73_9BORD|nr:GntR family transcriptional regulator [Bordetella ansorpii]SAI67675.1 GntR family transcriptional regulator [Bordetella ansorpii]